jgi:hypothetical protein
MKKLLFMIALVLGATAMNAQEMCCKTKNGTPVLPEAGEFSIGIDAVPVLNYFGNLFNQAGNNAAVGYQQANTITGTYMKTANLAYRGKLRIGLNNSSVDSVDTQSTNITVGGGIMKYRGKGRLQGYYGAEAGINTSSGSVSVSGTETKAPSTLGFYGRGFIGAQYFVAPKVSIGTEYGWGPSFNKTDDNSSFSLDVDNMGGAIYLSLFF